MERTTKRKIPKEPMDPGMRGNVYDLYPAMGVQEAEGVVRDGQSCFIKLYKRGSEAALKVIADNPIGPFDASMGEPSGDIQPVTEFVLDNYILWVPDDEDDDSEQWPDGLRAGAGWIYASLLQAIHLGCTKAKVSIITNDGNLFMVAHNEKDIAYEAVHVTYYGT